MLGQGQPPAWNQSGDQKAIGHVGGMYFMPDEALSIISKFSPSPTSLSITTWGVGVQRLGVRGPGEKTMDNSFDLLLMISPLCFQLFKKWFLV